MVKCNLQKNFLLAYFWRINAIICLCCGDRDSKKKVIS